MDGHVVARGIVPANLCTPQAFAQINLNIAHLVSFKQFLKKFFRYLTVLIFFCYRSPRKIITNFKETFSIFNFTFIFFAFPQINLKIAAPG
jgi:hypothetical protein